MPVPPRRKPFGRLRWQAGGLQCGDERRRQRFRDRDRASHQIALEARAQRQQLGGRHARFREPPERRQRRHQHCMPDSVCPTLKPGLARIALRPRLLPPRTAPTQNTRPSALYEHSRYADRTGGKSVYEPACSAVDRKHERFLEQLTLNQRVAGSSPAAPTMISKAYERRQRCLPSS